MAGRNPAEMFSTGAVALEGKAPDTKNIGPDITCVELPCRGLIGSCCAWAGPNFPCLDPARLASYSGRFKPYHRLPTLAAHTRSSLLRLPTLASVPLSLQTPNRWCGIQAAAVSEDVAGERQ